MADLIDLLDAYDRVVAAAAEIASPADLARAATVGNRARSRRGFLGETVVVALAGGTGSGKSSLLNALADDEVAATGPRRPTTSEPLAWIPANPEPGLIRLLDQIGIEQRVGQDRIPWLAVLDLPDTDSVEYDHRNIVERLLPQVDAVVWVVDPEKYQDAILHRDYLGPLASYGPQFRFVLNQIDRVAEEDRRPMVEDLRASLGADGIADPLILTTAADPALGPAVGIDAVVEALAALGTAKEVVARKLRTDLEESARNLASLAGIDAGSGVGFVERWEATADGASRSLADDVLGLPLTAEAVRVGRAAGRRGAAVLRRQRPPTEILIPAARRGGGLRQAVRAVDDLVTDVATEVGGDLAGELRSIGLESESELTEAATVMAVGHSVPLSDPPRWWAVASWLRRAAVAVALVGAVWLFDRIRAGGAVLEPAIMVLAALVLVGILGAAAAGSGVRWTTRALAERRGRLVDLLRREIDRRLGRPLRMVLRRRAGLGAALTEFELEAARVPDHSA